MNVLYEIKDKYESELKKIADKKELSPVDLEATYKIVDILKDIETICAMDEYGNDEDDWSGRSSYRRGRNQYSGYGMSGRRYSGGYSNGYSGHGSERMLENLYKAMDDADSEEQRMAIMNVINKMK